MVARFVEECLLLREIPTASQIHSGKIPAYLSPNFNKQINYLSIYIFIHDSIGYSPFTFENLDSTGKNRVYREKRSLVVRS